jgi:type IV pilus assembly protein PilC
MPIFGYSALNEKGRRISGQMTAANEIDLEEKLHGIGLDLVNSKERKSTTSAKFGSVTLQDMVIFCVHMQQLEKAGVPILESIADLRDSADNPHLKSIMSEIYESVRGGEVLSNALSRHPRAFNNIFVSLVRAGEKTGNLAEIFEHLSGHLKWVNNIHRKIKKATYYPIFLLLLMSGIVTLMMLFVIPKLSTFLKAQNFAMPGYTKALMATSDFFQNSWYLIFGVPALSIFIVKILVKVSDNFAYNVDNFKLQIPYFGQTIRKIELARFCQFFGIMYRSGLGILDCLDTANTTVENKVLKESVALVRKSVSEGNSLTESLRISSQFPNLVIRMFKVGEDSGNFDGTLENINFFYDREVDDAVNNMVGILQPALTMIMGGIMMWVSLAIFGPLYNSFSKMSF